MAETALLILVKMNAAACVMILLVLALRLPARRLCGAQVAYRLWIWPPLAAAGTLLPAHGQPWQAGWLDALAVRVVRASGLSEHPATVLAAWLAGALLFALALGVAQIMFLRAMKAGRAGPAVVGVLCPKIVMPASDPFTREERRLVREHELEHIRRGDTRANAAAALLRCLAWFNPLAHLAIRLLRFDQELACDDAVARRRPRTLAGYARALVKTQMAAGPLPLGCHWRAASRHPLEVRIAQLATARPPVLRQVAGAMLIGAVWLTLCGAAWVAAIMTNAGTFPPA